MATDSLNMDDIASPRIAVVTGAGSGVGRASALALLAAGFCVVLVGRRRAQLEETARLGGAAANCLVVDADITVEQDVIRVFRQAREHFGRVDVLFNNAGIFPPSTPIDEMPFALWRSTMAVNLDGAFLCAREAFRHMAQQVPAGGRIINNGSISAHAPRPGGAAYTASKHAITGLTKTIMLEGRQHNIACGQIDIGNAQTELTDAILSTGALQANGTVMPEPVMPVSDVAEAVVLMARLPLQSNIAFLTVMASAMPFVGRG
jgi:NAD(P)-dependent dehydrogenase (short-subunit alcohol dehydrogenase family)